jgi:hypothetical protein
MSDPSKPLPRKEPFTFFQPSPRCPRCAEGRGVPTAVRIAKSHRTVEYECHTCQHQWTLTDLSGSRV